MDLKALFIKARIIRPCSWLPSGDAKKSAMCVVMLASGESMPPSCGEVSSLIRSCSVFGEKMSDRDTLEKENPESVILIC